MAKESSPAPSKEDLIEVDGEKLAPYWQKTTTPVDWDKVVAAAYLRLRGLSALDCAKGVSCSQRSIRRWMNSDFWPRACEEATKRWMHDLTAASKTTLLKGIRAGDTEKALKILERTEPQLAPPAQQHEIFIDYMHRTDVVELARGMAMDVMEVVSDAEEREQIAERFRLRLERHTSKGGQHQLPPGNIEGGEVGP